MPCQKAPTVVSRNPEAADIYVCSLLDYGFGTPVLVADVKTEFAHAINESALYGCTCIEVNSYTGERLSPVKLGIPSTKTEAQLRLYLEGEDKLWSIPISPASPKRKTLSLYSKPLLCALYCGVQFIIQNSLCIPNRMACAVPLHYADLTPLKEGLDCRTFLNKADGLVYKFYSAVERPHEKPNSRHCSGNEVKLSSDVTLLTYKYVEGRMYPESLSQFSGALNDLAKLHDSGLVHGDIRLENFVFYDKTSKLIDYDKYGDCDLSRLFFSLGCYLMHLK